MISYDEVAGDKETFAEVRLDEARDYAAEDAHVTWLLDAKLGAGARRGGPGPALPGARAAADPGPGADGDERHRGRQRPSSRGSPRSSPTGIADAEARCYEAAGEEFKIGSVKQLREILFEKLGLPVIKKTKTGPSTNEQVLTELALQHPLPRAILDYRSLVKLKNTYVDPLPGLVNPETGRIHTHYSQTTAATGRLSSTDPNLQNIPVRTEEGRRIRQAFVAPPGRVLLAADYSQVELRILAHLCGGIGGFADAFAAGADVHAETAAGLFEVAAEEVDARDADHRQGGQLRHRLRSERLRPGPDSADFARRGRRLHQTLQANASRRSRTTASGPSKKPRRTAMSRPSWVDDVRSRISRAATSPHARRPNGWPSTPRSRAAPPTSSRRPC